MPPKKKKKKKKISRVQWFMPTIPAIQEVEIRRTAVGGPDKKLGKPQLNQQGGSVVYLSFNCTGGHK
jgi:hypothetical protein